MLCYGFTVAIAGECVGRSPSLANNSGLLFFTHMHTAVLNRHLSQRTMRHLKNKVAAWRKH
jgi:hypothetical protein